MSFADPQWCPTSAQVTVLQARGLRSKGKSGTNDAYAVMQVGKEKFQTSVMEKSVAPVWKEEATFDLPQGGGGGGGKGTLHVHVLHRALVGPDKPLGHAVVDLLCLSEDKTRNKTEWFKLLDKTGKADKDRGEVLLDIQFTRNNMTASMFDLSAAGKSRSRLGKFKDKVRGKKKESDAASGVVPSFTQVLTDSEEEEANEKEDDDEKKKKPKMKSLFSSKSNLQRNMSQSMSVLPAKTSSLSRSQSSGLNVESSEGKKKFKFMIHKRKSSSDGKDSSSGNQKHGGAAETSNLCINGSHVYCDGSNFSLSSSGHGSMEDVPGSSPPSVGSLKAGRQCSPWTEEEEEEEGEEDTAEVGNITEDVDEEQISVERREEERMRTQEGALEKTAEDKRRREEEETKRVEEEKVRWEEEERVRREEEQEHERLEQEKRRLEQERKRLEEEEERMKKEGQRRRLEEQERERIEEEERMKKEEERRRHEEERQLAQEARRKEERRAEEEKVRKEEEERIFREEEGKRREEEEKAIREEEEECERLAEEKRRLEEQERKRIEEEEEERIRMEEERRREEEHQVEEENRRMEAMRAEEERVRKEEERRRKEEEEREMKRKLEEQETRWRKEEEKRREEEEKEKEEHERSVREEKERIEAEEQIKKEAKERIKMEEEMRIRREEQERVKRDEEREEKKRLEEQERRRIEEEEQRQREEEERVKKEKEELERLAEEERRRKEEKEARRRRRREEEETERLAEEERRREKRRIEEEETQREEEQRFRRAEREEEEARKFTTDAEERKNHGHRSAGAARITADVTSTNPFDEDFPNNPSDDNPPSSTAADGSAVLSSVQQGCPIALSSKGGESVSMDEKNPINAQREKRPAPPPPGGRSVAESRRQRIGASSRHLAQNNKQSNDKDVKTASVLPQRSVQSIAPLSRDASSPDRGTESVGKHGKRLAPSRPAEEEPPSSDSKRVSSARGSVSSKTKRVPVVCGLNPFEDDEDDASTPGADESKLKSSKVTHAPPPPPATSSTLVHPDADRCHATDTTVVPAPDQGAQRARGPQPEAALSSVQNASLKEPVRVKKEAPPISSRRLLPVKPLNPQEQKSVSVVQGGKSHKSVGILGDVQEKTKITADSGLKGPYSQLTREELVSLLQKQENQMSDRDKQISELEQYIDKLLVRVMEEKPSILMSLNSLK